jgi:ketosteroid isomerase-like protein
VNREQVQAWLDRYVELWRIPDAAAIGELFAEDVTYRHGAYAPTIRGREALVEHWLADPDPDDSWTADWKVEMVAGELAAASGTTISPDNARPGYPGEYSNVFLLRFDSEGRCVDYREWWMPAPRRREP